MLSQSNAHNVSRLLTLAIMTITGVWQFWRAYYRYYSVKGRKTEESHRPKGSWQNFARITDRQTDRHTHTHTIKIHFTSHLKV